METATAPEEITDAQLKEKIEAVRRRVSGSDSRTESPSTTSPAPTDERVIPCPDCTKFRRVDHPNELRQRRLEVLGTDYWFPKTCTDCNDWIAAEQKRREDREEEESLRRRMNASRLPRPYIVGARGTADLANAPKTDGFAVARMLCARLVSGKLDRPWLWLWSSETGTYKTTLACCTLQQVISAGGNGRFVNVPEFFEDLRGTYNADAREDEGSVIDPVRITPRLVLDEIAQEKPSAHNAEVLYRIINKRFELDSEAEPGKRWLIFTSNGSIGDFLERYSGSIDSEKTALRLERRVMEMTTEVNVTA